MEPPNVDFLNALNVYAVNERYSANIFMHKPDCAPIQPLATGRSNIYIGISQNGNDVLFNFA